MTLFRIRGKCLFEAGQCVGWDQRRFAAPAHQQFSMFQDGGPALEASLSHPTLKRRWPCSTSSPHFRVAGDRL